eukprot:TRINITY_DN7320_c0_g1_i1.p2 TRINITY_DN7320_c0_g1~~TRINITY_DN7320_c0_g1_i1.p2  ORF type:complete len:154 (-),score=21.11 TRINITY_DN7320_c0_g1_i1:125-586(-)
MDPLWGTVQELVGLPEQLEKMLNAPTRKYVRETKAMASTPVDVKEYPGKYVFVIDMPGLKSQQIKVQIEDENVLTVTGERKREDEDSKDKEKDVKYLRMERRVGKFMRKFTLPDDCDQNAISASCIDGVLTVTVPKRPPPEPKKPKTIQVQVA